MKRIIDYKKLEERFDEEIQEGNLSYMSVTRVWKIIHDVEE